MALRVKRVYEEPKEVDGERILVDLPWPRGRSKDKAEITAWRKDPAPSNELRKWFGHEADPWAGFMKRYRVELEETGKTEDHLKIGARAAERNDNPPLWRQGHRIQQRPGAYNFRLQA